MNIQILHKIFKNNAKNLYAIILFLIFIVFTAKASFFSGRLGWEDESHFWIIIKNCSIAQIYELMKVEGHMMLWYLVVKPFTFLKYPYPMQVINWLFCVGAMLLLWIKAPFDKLTKTLIILSPVFFSLYSVHARCYSIAAFFLFLACAMYKDRLNKPYLYFVILLLAANTHIIALFAASAIGLVFLYDLYKNRKTKEAVVISVMTILTGIFLFFQFYGVNVPDYENLFYRNDDINNLFGVFFGFIPIKYSKVLLHKIIAARCFVVFMTFAFATRVRVFFVYLFIYFTTFFFMAFVYSPRVWHNAFFFVYFVVCYWLFLEENPNVNVVKYFRKMVYALLLMLLLVKIIIPHDEDFLYYLVDKHKELQTSKIYTTIWPITISISLPQLNEKGIRVYDLNNRDLSSFEGLLTYYDMEKKKYNPENIRLHMDKGKTNYLVTMRQLRKNEKLYLYVKGKPYLAGTRNGYKYYVYELVEN